MVTSKAVVTQLSFANETPSVRRVFSLLLRQSHSTNFAYDEGIAESSRATVVNCGILDHRYEEIWAITNRLWLRSLVSYHLIGCVSYIRRFCVSAATETRRKTDLHAVKP